MRLLLDYRLICLSKALQFMKDFHAYLVDIDGVLLRGDHVLPGAQEFISWLDSTGRRLRFITNNADATPDEVAQRLYRLQIPSPCGRVITAGAAAAQTLAERFPHGRIFLLGSHSIGHLLLERGLQTIRSYMVDEEPPDAVLVALDRHLSYHSLNGALAALLAGAAFFAVNQDPRVPVEKAFNMEVGAIAASLEYASGRKAEIIGKPAPTMLLQAMSQLQVPPEETVMIGDGLDMDISAGHAAGVACVLLLTGLTTAEEASIAVDARQPDYIFPTLVDLLRAQQID